jgi:hypothetical protein
MMCYELINPLYPPILGEEKIGDTPNTLAEDYSPAPLFHNRHSGAGRNPDVGSILPYILISWKDRAPTILRYIIRADDSPRYRAGGSYGRIGQIDLGLVAAHAPDKVAVRRRYALLAGSQHTHVPAETWAARRRAHSRTRVNESFD